MGDSGQPSFDFSKAKRELLAALLQEEDLAASAPPAIPRRPEGAPVPLSFAQERLWFLNQLEGPNATYNVALAFRLDGKLDAPGLQSGFDALVQRHEALRTTFTLVDSQPVQVIGRLPYSALACTDLCHLPPEVRLVEAGRLAREAANAPFDLARGPLLRAKLFRLEEEEHLLVVALHHIIADEWSLDVLFGELSELYTAYQAKRAPDLPELPVQYGDYALWQRAWLAGAPAGDQPAGGERPGGGTSPLEAQLDYWKEKLSGAPQALDLPLDRPRPATQTFRGAACTRLLPVDLLQSLRALSQSRRATLFSTLLASFAVLLYRSAGQEDFLIGSPVANRGRPELQGLAGLFLNTLALRCDLSGNPPFVELLDRTGGTVLEALENADLPFEKLVEELKPERDLSRHPLFQVMLVFQPENGEPLRLPGIRSQRWELERGTAKFDLTLYARAGAEGLRLLLEYNTDLFDPATTDRLLDRFTTLLEGIVADPTQPAGSLPIWTEAELRQALLDWNRTRSDYPREKCAHQLFEEQARRSPQAVALVHGEQQLTYAELDRRADILAGWLRSQGVGPDSVVALCASRSVELLVGMLAILKAGGAYLPLDPAYPRARLAFMLQDAGARLLLTHGVDPADLPQFDGLVLSLGDDRYPEEQTGDGVVINPGPENLAYLLYTSGSTGNPKGVAMPHRSLVNLISWQLQQPGFSGPARTLQYTSLSFDVSFQEIFSTWCSGGTLVLVSTETHTDPALLLPFLHDQQVERLFLPFVALQSLAEAAERLGTIPAFLREVVTAGEQLQMTPQIVRLFRKLPGCRLHNHYGPTEAHVVTAYTLAGPPESWPPLPPIGRPIANVQIYLLDGSGQPVPVGVPGELCIGGDCLARGYLNRPELNNERFIPNLLAPYSPAPLSPSPSGDRLYRTGDLARWLPDGNLEYLGRRDQQVKIRGYRVELGEVEATLQQYPGVRNAAVAIREDPQRGKVLTAYVSGDWGAGENRPDSDLQARLPSELHNFLKERLPDYMLPAGYLLMEELPKTPSGKVDRLNLPATAAAVPTGEFTAPRDALEEQLALIWAQVLGVPRVGVNDDFFDLGGHSLLGIRLFAQIEEQLGQRLPLALLFQSPTVAGLAGQLRGEYSRAGWSILVPIRTQGSRPPFFIVHGFGGGVLGYAALVRQLGSDQPVYGLQAWGLDGKQPPDTGIEQMASRYIEVLRAVQPTGPYSMGGYCLGGVIAYEMARQLHAMGEQVSHVAILEGYAPVRLQGRRSLLHPRRLLNFLRNLPFWVEDYFEQGLGGMWAQASKRVTILAKNAAGRLGVRLDVAPKDIIGEDAAQVPAYLHRILELQIQAQIHYNPGVYPGKVTLYRVRRLSLMRGDDPLMGWGRLAQAGVAVRMVPGRHNNMLNEPYVQSLAAQLKQDLEEGEWK